MQIWQEESKIWYKQTTTQTKQSLETNYQFVLLSLLLVVIIAFDVTSDASNLIWLTS